MRSVRQDSSTEPLKAQARRPLLGRPLDRRVAIRVSKRRAPVSAQSVWKGSAQGAFRRQGRGPEWVRPPRKPRYPEKSDSPRAAGVRRFFQKTARRALPRRAAAAAFRHFCSETPLTSQRGLIGGCESSPFMWMWRVLISDKVFHKWIVFPHHVVHIFIDFLQILIGKGAELAGVRQFNGEVLCESVLKFRRLVRKCRRLKIEHAVVLEGNVFTSPKAAGGAYTPILQ